MTVYLSRTGKITNVISSRVFYLKGLKFLMKNLHFLYEQGISIKLS